LYFGIAESQGRGTLRCDLTRTVDLLEDFFRQDTVMGGFLDGDFLDLQQSSIGLESNGPQSGQVVQSPVDIEIVRVIDGGLSSQDTAFLWYCLMRVPL